MPYVGYIWISDDAFLARNLSDINEFCIQYKEKINLPFSCLASPLTVTHEKMDALVDAGLIYIQMGIGLGLPGFTTTNTKTALSRSITIPPQSPTG